MLEKKRQRRTEQKSFLLLLKFIIIHYGRGKECRNAKRAELKKKFREQKLLKMAKLFNELLSLRTRKRVKWASGKKENKKIFKISK